jgi:WD40 repeat protein
VAFSPDGGTLAAADYNGSVYLWRLGTGRPTMARSIADPAGQGVYSVAYSSTGMLATGDYADNVYLWKPGLATPAASFSLAGVGSFAVSALAFSPGGGLLAAADKKGHALLWDVVTSRGVPLAMPAGSPVWGASFGSGVLALADKDGRAYLWRIETSAPAATLIGYLADPSRGSNGIGALAFSNDGKYLVTGDTNGSSYLWHTR